MQVETIRKNFDRVDTLLSPQSSPASIVIFLDNSQNFFSIRIFLASSYTVHMSRSGIRVPRVIIEEKSRKSSITDRNKFLEALRSVASLALQLAYSYDLTIYARSPVTLDCIIRTSVRVRRLNERRNSANPTYVCAWGKRAKHVGTFAKPENLSTTLTRNWHIIATRLVLHAITL